MKSSKHQHPSSRETSSSKHQLLRVCSNGRLVIGASLDVGCWMLVLTDTDTSQLTPHFDHGVPVIQTLTRQTSIRRLLNLFWHVKLR
jgi:hypothetical protein